MAPEIKELETEAEVTRWLEKHGYGPGLIAEELAAWKTSNKPVVAKLEVAKPVVAKPEVTTTSTKK